ncbi:MAG: ABC transporter permease [Tissierellia bacterium]|nr:ABC transporter permease [Tissierellia bacterium]
MDANYLASIINSTIRSTTPVLLAALGSAICSQVGVFNIALEGQMLIASFTAIIVNYFTGSVALAVFAGVLSGALIGAIVAVLQVKYEAADMVIGTSINLLVTGLTSILLFVLLGVKGSFSNPKLIPLKKITLPIINKIPFVGRVMEGLTIIDYLSYLIAILIFIYLYKTVSGFRVLSIGINKEAAESLGVKAIRTRMLVVIMSGALCGLGGTVLSMGQVTLFTENMTAGRGFIAMAAGGMAQNHPLFVIFSSLFFGAAQALGVALQNVVPSQLTMSIPYIATILALAVFSKKRKKQIIK